MRVEPVEIAISDEGPEEGIVLEAVVHAPDAAPARAAIVCHPHPAFGGNMDNPIIVALAEALASAGLLAVRFNFRGTGRSTGKPTGGRVEERDVAAAAAFVRANIDRPPVAVGYSLGALMAAKAIAGGLAVERAISIALPTVIVGDHPDRIADVERALAAAPTLLLAGTDDQFVEIPRLRAFAAGRPGVELCALPGQGHFFAGPALDDVVARAVAFATR